MKVEHVPFSLQDLKHVQLLTEDRQYEVSGYLTIYWSAYKADKLVKDLKKNPPKESFENPVVQQCSSFKEYMAMTNLIADLDLPGSQYNPFGMINYNDLFFCMFFGNYSEFNEHIKKLSKHELKKFLNTREGYPQFSPVFAPIIGRRMIHIEEIGMAH